MLPEALTATGITSFGPPVRHSSPPRYCLWLAIGLISWAAPALAQESESPAPDEAAEVVARLHEGLAAAHPMDIERRNELLEPIVSDTHDLPYIARFVLRRHWPDLGSDEQREFTRRFRKLSVMNYASRFATIDPDALTIGNVALLRDTRAQVAAAIAGEERDITLSYTLHLSDGRWRIIDVVADDVSDLALRRAEYGRVMNERGFQGLLRHLDSQTSELRKADESVSPDPMGR